ncbi:MAG: hypothetical protein HY084_05090 [Gemmatimonadetes bacterium]|nr:hypothetical protein [Gemmatimonadota bacterium]
MARKDPALAAEGAVVFLERLSPALEQVDSSSGALGSAVHHAIAALVPVIAHATGDDATRDAWLERLWAAHVADEIPYIECLGDYWGDLCASREVASRWADRLMDDTRRALAPARPTRAFFKGTSACLSALLASQRFDEMMQLLASETFWPYKQWSVKALLAQGRKAEAVRQAEACRSPWSNDRAVDVMCEEILLSSGLAEEAYRRYGLRAHTTGSYAATFRAVTKRYPDRAAREVLADLVGTTPGLEGKWFAAAKDAGFLDYAITLARLSPVDPKTLARAARDFAESESVFAIEAGLLAIEGFANGLGFEVTGADVLMAYVGAMTAGTNVERSPEVRVRLAEMLRQERVGTVFVRQALGVLAGKG